MTCNCFCSRLTIRTGALLIAFTAASVLAGAFFFQYVLNVLPCALCYQQRYAYYFAVPIALLAAFVPERPARVLLGVVALAFVAGAALGVYHSGVEWKYWVGPNTCSDGMSITGSGSLLQQLEATPFVSCSDAGWRFLGLSLAGWNVVIAAFIAAFAARLAIGGNRQGSSSLSQ